MSVVTAPPVPLPTDLTAAACAFVAASPVTGFSRDSCSGEPWAGKSGGGLGASAITDELPASEGAGVEVRDPVAALAEPRSVAPRAPPAIVAAANAPPTAILRRTFIWFRSLF